MVPGPETFWLKGSALPYKHDRHVWNQTFEPRDLLIILVLVGLEGILSLDNALVLGLLARRLPQGMQAKALTYGLVGAVVFRLLAIFVAARLLQWRWVKLVGGGYLLYVAAKDLFFKHHDPARPEPHGGAGASLTQHFAPGGDLKRIGSTHTKAFWVAVGSIELTDIAFAVDSVVAAIALVGPAPAGSEPGEHLLHPKFWVIATGGLVGVALMRFAAVIFIKLVKRFPRFELSAYLLVAVIGLKLVLDWAFNAHTHQLDFEHPASPAFWVFWAVMAVCAATGFLPVRAAKPS